MTDAWKCDVLPDSDMHEAPADYYVEWDEVWGDDKLGYAATACADCAARLRAGEILMELMTEPVVVLIRDIATHRLLCEKR